MHNRAIYNSDHELFRDNARRFFREELEPNIDRWELEGVLREHEILARFHAMVTSSEQDDEELARELEKKKPEARLLGGSVLMYTRDSELVATIAHDARYAGRSGAVVIYVLRRR